MKSVLNMFLSSIYLCEFVIWSILCLPLTIAMMLDPSAEPGIWLLGYFPYFGYLGFRFVVATGGEILIIITILPLIILIIGDYIRLLAYKSLYRGPQPVTFYVLKERPGRGK